MNPTELFIQTGKSEFDGHPPFKPANIFYCGSCRVVHRDFAGAEVCCAPYKCARCGAECERHHTRCQTCVTAVELEVESARFDKAIKLTQWGDWVYSEGHGHSDGYFMDVGELMDWLDSEFEGAPSDRPTYCWTCKPVAFAHTDVEQCTEHILDNAYEDFDFDQLKGMPEFKAAIKAFNEANKAICAYHPDYTTAVLLK